MAGDINSLNLLVSFILQSAIEVVIKTSRTLNKGKQQKYQKVSLNKQHVRMGIYLEALA